MDKLPWELVELILTDIHPAISTLVCKQWYELTKGSRSQRPRVFLSVQAVDNGWVNVLYWFRKMRWKLYDGSCIRAAARDDLKMVKWLLSKGCHMTSDMFIFAAKADTHEVFNWLTTRPQICKKFARESTAMDAIYFDSPIALDWVLNHYTNRDLDYHLVNHAVDLDKPDILDQLLQRMDYVSKRCICNRFLQFRYLSADIVGVFVTHVYPSCLPNIEDFMTAIPL